VTADLKAMTSAWIGLSSLESEIARERIALVGSVTLTQSIADWMQRSSFAAE
jgi:hypothetical protein